MPGRITSPKAAILTPARKKGTGALAALEELPGERVLVITDGFLAKSGLLDKVLAHLKGRTVEIFDQVVPDPPIDLVAKGARALADFKPRTVVAFGGGSPMDCAKAMLLFGKKLGALGEITFATSCSPTRPFWIPPCWRGCRRR